MHAFLQRGVPTQDTRAAMLLSVEQVLRSAFKVVLMCYRASQWTWTMSMTLWLAQSKLSKIGSVNWRLKQNFGYSPSHLCQRMLPASFIFLACSAFVVLWEHCNC